MNCTKAIIPMGGFGTRRLPVTKAIDKCMMPIGNRPLVDYIVEDCIRAGIEDIYFVVNENHEQVKTYYGHNQLLENYLASRGKFDELINIQNIATKARFHYVVQDRSQPYGTAVPVNLCQNIIAADEQVIVLMGDDLIYNSDGHSEVAHLMQAVEQAGLTAGLLAVEVPAEETYRYGVLDFEDRDGQRIFKKIVEKPAPQRAPSNLINISKYLFDSQMLQCVAQVLQDLPSASGEYLITDALNHYQAAGRQIAVVPALGEYLDGGSLEGWLHANNRVCQDILAK